MIHLLSTNGQGGSGELEDDRPCFLFFAASALVLRDRSGDRDDNRRIFLDTVTTAVFLERPATAFLLAASTLVTAVAWVRDCVPLVRGNCGSFGGNRFLDPMASISSMPSWIEQSTFPADSLALACRMFPLFGGTSDCVSDLLSSYTLS